MSRQAPPRPRARHGGAGAGIRGVARRHRLLAAVAALAVLAVTVLAGGELTARRLISDKVVGKLSVLGNVQVSTNGSLALWDILSKRIPRLDITGDDATVGPFTQVAVRATLDGVTLGATPTVTSSHAVITVPDSSIATAIQAKVSRVRVAAVTSDPGAGTLTVAIGPGGIGRLALRPALAHGKVTFSAVSLTVMGSPVPLSALGSAGAGLSTGLSTGLGTGLGSGAGSGLGARHPYPFGLAVTGLRVTSGGVRLTLDGGRATLRGA